MRRRAEPEVFISHEGIGHALGVADIVARRAAAVLKLPIEFIEILARIARHMAGSACSANDIAVQAFYVWLGGDLPPGGNKCRVKVDGTRRVKPANQLLDSSARLRVQHREVELLIGQIFLAKVSWVKSRNPG